MSDYFKDIPTIKYEGRDSTNPLSFKFYDANKKILGKTLEEHLRMAVCYWHTFNWPGTTVAFLSFAIFLSFFTDSTTSTAEQTRPGSVRLFQ